MSKSKPKKAKRDKVQQTKPREIQGMTALTGMKSIPGMTGITDIITQALKKTSTTNQSQGDNYGDILAQALKKWYYDQFVEKFCSICYETKDEVLDALLRTPYEDILGACYECNDFLLEKDIRRLSALVKLFQRSPMDRERVIKAINGMFERNKEAFIKIRCFNMNYEKNIAELTENDFKNETEDVFD
jgi:hypothetical protein